MASEFDELMSELGVPVLMDHLADADSITYTDGGGAVTLKAILYDEEAEEVETIDGLVRRIVREITITTDPAGEWGGVAAPKLAATVTIDSVEYAVEAIARRSDNLATLRLVRRSGVEVTRPNYRRS